jgi:signal transduction histidine kinase
MNTFIISFIISSTLVELLFFLFILNKKQLYSIMLNTAVVFSLLLPSLFDAYMTREAATLIQAIGLSLFPASYALLLNHLYFGAKKMRPVPLVIISLLFLAAALLLGNLSILSLLIIAHCFYTVYVITNNTPSITRSHLLLYGLIAQVLVILAALYTNTEIYLLESVGGIFLLTTLLYLTHYLNRTSIILKNIKKSRELNKILFHKITQLSNKAERLKRIIHQKDLELLQMSKHASLAEITAGIAHELMQPLTGIKCISQNMIDDINYEELENLHAVSELSKIGTLVDKSSSIINHIRSFSKKSSLTMHFIDINKVILGALDLIQLPIKKYSIEIILKLGEDLPKIYGDTIALEQLIINLLLNARDAIIEKRNVDNQDYNGYIQITTQKNTNSINLIIDDNGIGITPENIKSIWMPFFTTKKRSDSTGLGLSISNKILKEHNGKILIDSKPGQGTRFTISFPIRDAVRAVL